MNVGKYGMGEGLDTALQKASASNDNRPSVETERRWVTPLTAHSAQSLITDNILGWNVDREKEVEENVETFRMEFAKLPPNEQQSVASAVRDFLPTFEIGNVRITLTPAIVEERKRLISEVIDAATQEEDLKLAA